ncbi:FimB/Mfa2 family fimbrial subunit [Phocaeicola sp. HCN-6420]|uniref:FimB/Mfa2 family fimbrial subunit n=1 Tax=Phocaeicola sp. HCN-6420 TaxID=3134673 RepID=UPI0030C559E0
MKKNYLLGMALMASLSFYSCDKEVVYVQDGNGVESVTDGAQIITLQVENGGDGLATRAGRPLYSAEAKQTIENVKLWICDNTGKVVYVKEISDWNTDGSTVYTTGGHGRQTTIELKDADKLAAGTYKIYAVGYSSNSDYTLDAVTSVAKEGTFKENMVLPIKDGAANKIGEEIFAGQIMELTVTEGKGFKEPIVLNRQVAGAFAYVKDIPYMEGAKYLKLVASAQNESLVLGHFNSFDLTGNGSGNDVNVKYVVNGTNGKSGSETYEISSIDLTQWFTNIADNDGDNLIDAGDNWKNPYSSEGHPTFQKGSAFGGEFVIPFAHVDGKQTLTLQLTNEGGTVLRSWKVNLGSADEQLKQTITCWNSESTDWSTSLSGESSNTYSLVRNHLYGIGTRMNDEVDPEQPGVDPDPDPEDPDDKPESLNNKQELVLKVNDNWEVIHGMELD